MVINGDKLLFMSPMEDMIPSKQRQFGVSHGLAEVGYDIRLKQEILFIPGKQYTFYSREIREEGIYNVPHTLQEISEIYCFDDDGTNSLTYGNFVLASAIERFIMPPDLVGIVHDKSTWARQGLSVFNTVIEPGWEGYLTLELAFRGNEPVHIPAGAGIAQVIFHETFERAAYAGKYQNQDNRPVAAIAA